MCTALCVGGAEAQAEGQAYEAVPRVEAGSSSQTLGATSQQPATLAAADVAAALESNESRRTFTITLAPLWLLLPVLDITVEGRAGDRASVALTGGFGTILLLGESGPSLVDVGASTRYYVRGDFDGGVALGVDASYLHLFAHADQGPFTVMGFGPMLAVKSVADSGFTYDCRFGARAYSARGGEPTARVGNSHIALFLHLNLGWSF